jgi:hypothetical protein
MGNPFVWKIVLQPGTHTQTTNKLHGLSPRANYTDQATAACRRSDGSGKAHKQIYSKLQPCPLVREGATK